MGFRTLLLLTGASGKQLPSESVPENDDACDEEEYNKEDMYVGRWAGAKAAAERR